MQTLRYRIRKPRFNARPVNRFPGGRRAFLVWIGLQVVAAEVGVGQDSRWVVYGLIGINLLVHLLWLMYGVKSEAGAEWMTDQFTLSFSGLMAGRVWTLLTSVFSHVDSTHFLFNMFALYGFGGTVIQVIGVRRFLGLYFVGGLLSSVGFVVWQVVAGETSVALGASGAVMAVAVVFAALFPKAILRINFIFPVPAVLAVAGFILLDLLGILVDFDATVAHAAHLGGAAYGLLYWFVALRGRLRVS